MKKENKIQREENIEKLTKVIEEKTKTPKKLKDRITDKAYENILFAVIVIIYLGALNLGMSNIPTETYLMDLKVFSIMLLIFTIILFEMGYKKDNTGLWIHGVEVMVAGIFTTYLIYLYSIYFGVARKFSICILWNIFNILCYKNTYYEKKNGKKI